MNKFTTCAIVGTFVVLSVLAPEASADFWDKVTKPFKATYKKVLKPVGRDVIVKPSKWTYRKAIKPVGRAGRDVLEFFAQESGSENNKAPQTNKPPQPAQQLHWYFFKLTNPHSRINPCFVTAVRAADAKTAKRLAHNQATNYSIKQITAAEYYDPNTCKRP